MVKSKLYSLLICISLLLSGQLIAQPVKKEIRIKNVNDLYQFINSDVTLLLEPGDYHLEQVDSELINPKANWALVLFDEIEYNETYDEDKTLLVRDVYNLTIKSAGGPNDTVRILTNRRTASVFAFQNCQNIKIEGITFGHDMIKYTDPNNPWESFCSGEVLEFFDCTEIDISESTLFGCGTRGFLAHRCENFKLSNSIIKECSWGAWGLFNSKNFDISDCQVYDNTYRQLIEIDESHSILVKNTVLKDNKPGNYSEASLRISKSKNISFINCTFTDNFFTEQEFLNNLPE